jgi:Mg2+ and Co2+ transporter CorA
VTCYSNPQLPAVVGTLEKIRKDWRIARFGPVFLCHTILDNFGDEYLPNLGKLVSELEWLEDSAIEIRLLKLCTGFSGSNTRP